jgi:hypothetical protein
VRGFVSGQEYFLAEALSALYLDVKPLSVSVLAFEVVSKMLMPYAPKVSPPCSLEVVLSVQL